MAYLLVGAGGALGSIARYWLTLTVDRATGAGFPFGTLMVNVIGALLIGLVAGFASVEGRISQEARWLLMAGLCGGFTTFSAFSLQTLELLRRGETLHATLYALGSVLVCLLATALGYSLTAARL